jgi:hypothetical protein
MDVDTTPRKEIPERTLDARPDTLDFRDRMFEPTLVEVPVHIPLEDYREWGVPILDQGSEGACTGFGLATVAHHLLRRRSVVRDDIPVSPRMFYEMARRYDEWPGEAYAGSSARGAMKGWHKHGVCAGELWPYEADEPGHLTPDKSADALRRPLGAYYRVNHQDVVAMHAALAEVKALYATARVHEGWRHVGSDGIIEQSETLIGGHAFAIVAFDALGFWIQNSWGDDWGFEGFALVSYEDWLTNGTDVWVARLGAPIHMTSGASAAAASGVAPESEVFAYQSLRPHIVSTGNGGRLRPHGTFGTDAGDVRTIFEHDIPNITSGWEKKRLLVYAHGGLVGESGAVQRVSEYRKECLEREIYPLAFIWKSDFWTTLTNILEDAFERRRDEGFLDSAKDFMLDRLDDALEPLARALMGKMQWDEMKENALGATTSQDGGARLVANHLAAQARSDPSVEIHIVGHSAGAIFLAPFVQMLTQELELGIASCTLWAPACTIETFTAHYAPALDSGTIDRFALFTLTDQAEQDDHCANVYHKSLLYLVSNAFEDEPRIPLIRPGEPLLGMERYVREDPRVLSLLIAPNRRWVLAPNTEESGSPTASRAKRHSDFDDDEVTIRAMIAQVLGRDVRRRVRVRRSAASIVDRRKQLVGRRSRDGS